MILPERVLGSVSLKRMSSGTAWAPISLKAPDQPVVKPVELVPRLAQDRRGRNPFEQLPQLLLRVGKLFAFCVVVRPMK
jgi:hypothetical protein